MKSFDRESADTLLMSLDAAQAFKARAVELGLLTPSLPFGSVCMDGKPYSSGFSRGEHRIFPTAFEEPSDRLQRIGNMWSHQGVLEYVDQDGAYHIARNVATNQAALRNAGFVSAGIFGTFFTNGQFPEGAHREAFEAILTTPENEDERLLWAVRDEDVRVFTQALTDGADIKRAKEIYRRTVLHHAIDLRFKSADNVTKILTPLLADGRNFASEGVPEFLWLSPDDPHARQKLALVKEAMLAVSDLSKSDRLFIGKQMEIATDALGNSDDGYRTFERLRDVWSSAHGFEAIPDDGLRIPVIIRDFLEPIVEPKRATKLMQALQAYPLSKLKGVDDLAEEFCTHVVLPQLLLRYHQELGITVTDESLRALDAGPRNHLCETVLGAVTPIVKRALFRGRSLDKIIGLNEAWHDPNVFFPDILKPLKARGEWHSLSGQKIHRPSDVPDLSKVTIHVLTNHNELAAEGSFLAHCVGRGSYTTKALSGRSHLFSVRDLMGERLSTIEAQWDGNTFHIEQNRSFRNEDPPSMAAAAAAWLKKQFESGAIKASAKLGETEASKKLSQTTPQILRTIGFALTDANIDAAFAEFARSETSRNSLRRAREYNPQSRKFDIISKRTELITGTIDNGGHGISLKSLSAREWFVITGLNEVTWEASPLKRLAATQLKLRVAAAPQAEMVVPLPAASDVLGRGVSAPSGNGGNESRSRAFNPLAVVKNAYRWACNRVHQPPTRPKQTSSPASGPGLSGGD